MIDAGVRIIDAGVRMIDAGPEVFRSPHLRQRVRIPDFPVRSGTRGSSGFSARLPIFFFLKVFQ